MKTTLKTLVAALLLATSAHATAQDTLFSREIPGNYQQPYYWLDSAAWDTIEFISTGSEQCGIAGHQVGIIKHADSALTVYGIAAGLSCRLDFGDSTEIEWFSHGIADTSRVALEDEQLRLWVFEDSDIVQRGEDLTVKIGSEKPDYYWDWQVDSGRVHMPIHMFERYFAEPVVVTDSFMIGKPTVNGLAPEGGAYVANGHLVEHRNWPVSIRGYYFSCGLDLVHSGEYVMSCMPKSSDDDGLFHRERGDYVHYIIFPILTPNPDTTSDGIGNVRAEERLVVVMPNPATGQVKVVSSFGLTAVEVYDAAGRRVLSRDAQGLQTRIDVSAWPRGAYVVHIHTPHGTAVKKLLVE